MAPKQPDWTFLESLSPDDLEDDDTEKVGVTKSSIYSMSIQTTELDACGPIQQEASETHDGHAVSSE